MDIQYQVLLQLGLTKTMKNTVFEDATDGDGQDDDADDDPYKEVIPKKKTNKKRKKCSEVCCDKAEKVVEADPASICRDRDMASCTTKIAGNWCCKTAPDLPQFSDDEEEEQDGMDIDESSSDGDSDDDMDSDETDEAGSPPEVKFVCAVVCDICV